jgi:hypothetical protein
MVRNISLLLPALSLAVVLLVSMRPEITGMSVATGGVVEAGVRLKTAEGVVLPAGAEISVSAGGESSSMGASEFIEASGGAYELSDGEAPAIGYSGEGYTGNHTYTVPLSAFGISRRLPEGKHTLRVTVAYGGEVITEAEEEVTV